MINIITITLLIRNVVFSAEFLAKDEKCKFNLRKRTMRIHENVN